MAAAGAGGEAENTRFPAGTYDFIGACDDLAGEHLTCALFSPMDMFADQPTAVLTAELALAALFDAAHAQPPDRRRPTDDAGAGRHWRKARGAGAHEPMSKRDFLRGRFLRADEPDVPGR